MSNDEIMVLLISTGLGISLWGKWYHTIFRLHEFFRAKKERIILSTIPIICFAGLFVVLKTIASYDVVTNPTYIGFYLAMGSAWVAMTMFVLPLLGISWRDDALERKNQAVVVTVCGALIGATACFSGANVGDGPGWWCVVFAVVSELSFQNRVRQGWGESRSSAHDDCNSGFGRALAWKHYCEDDPMLSQ